MTNELHMTMDQMIEEIKIMREFESFLWKHIPEELAFLTTAFARETCIKELVKAGIPEEDANACLDVIERDLGVSTDEQ